MSLIEDIIAPEIQPAIDIQLTLDEIRIIHKALQQYWKIQPFHPGLNDDTLALVEQFKWIKDCIEGNTCKN